MQKGLGLLIILGIIIFIIVQIFQFIAENWIVIFSSVIIVIIIISLFNYFTNQENKRESYIEKLEQLRLDITNQYEKQKSLISKSKEARIRKIEELIENLDSNKIDNHNLYLGITERATISQNAINKLENILIENDMDNISVWDLFYDKSDFKDINPRIMIGEELSKVNNLNKLDFVEIDIPTKLNDKKNNSLSFEIEEKKNEVNKNLEEYYEVSLKELNLIENILENKIREKEKKWENSKESFYNDQRIKNSQIDNLKIDYQKKRKQAIEIFCSKLLQNINYYSEFEKSIEIEYNETNKILIVDYLLPSIENFPTLKEIRFIKTRNEYKEVDFSQKELEKLFDETIYRIILNSISKLFINDSINELESIVFNGWTNSINRAIGKTIKACIISVHCNKNEFLNINLSEVEPKICFKNLKGISASKISNLTPIKPLLSIDKHDKRFVSSKEVEINSYTNIAAMHWEDFEHLIREIFEREFSNNGGEVKVTQTSRDGGVDAVAFDPDPIKGGKIVIQAKRYTNIVGVSAVRDLYGTVLNEGASKGILVTTSDFGSDSYEFAKNKPLTLINGGNLLYLLEKHGHKARININEAEEEQKQAKP
ncbi:MAG: restriction endonuclease [Bacteroidetes bacterium]|nr:restriction endonuclease [Bacteroidota bacterium]